MKNRILILLSTFLLSLTAAAGSYQQAMERLAAENPEMVMHADLEQDFSVLGKFLTEVYLGYQASSPEVPPVPVDYEMLFQRLGLLNLQSATFTSEREEDGDFLNKGIFLFEGAPEGAFLLTGSSNQPFTILSSAPADAAAVAEVGLEGTALLEIIRNVAVDLMGPMGQGIVDAQLSQPITADGLTALDIINRLNTRLHAAMKPAAADGTEIHPGMVLLKGNIAIRLMSVGDLLTSVGPLLQGVGFMPTEDGTAFIYSSPAPELPLEVRLESLPESNDLLITTSSASREWFLNSATSIGDSAELQAAMKGFPDSGLSLWYDDGTLGALQIDNAMADLQQSGQLLPVVESLISFMKAFTGAQSGVSFLEEDAYRVVSRQPTSYKTQAALTAVAVPVGLLAALNPLEAAMQEDQPLPEDSE
ncbi:MAG: hypothetical protein AB3N33_09045 [Puniceicoccaceae bacterium]